MPRTPLTLEFKPNDIEHEPGDLPEGSEPIVVAEPAMTDGSAGRIFVGVNPLGYRMGVSMVPDEVKMLRDHLTKLLLEKPEDVEAAVAEGVAATAEDTGETYDVQERLQAAIRRAGISQKPKKRKRRRIFPHFRLEFQVGRTQGVIGTLVDDDG